MRTPEHVAPTAKKALKMPVFLLFYRHHMDTARSAWARRSPFLPWICGKKYTYLFVYFTYLFVYLV